MPTLLSDVVKSGISGYTTTASITAGTNAQGQGPIVSEYNIITTTTSNPSGVTLPVSTPGKRCIIVNRGSNLVKVYPATDGYIDGLAINTAIDLPVNGWMEFNASTTTRWYSSYNITAPIPDELNDLIDVVITTPSTNQVLAYNGTNWVNTSAPGDMLKATYDTNNDGIVDQAASVPWSGITGVPSTFTPSSHTHVIGDVTGLQSALDGKASSTHTHVIGDVTGLQTALDGKQASLVSGTNIKTINSTSILGSGDLAVQETLVSGTNIKTINSTSILGSGDLAVQETLVSGTSIKTINSTSILGSGDLAVQETLVSGTNIKTINGTSVLGSGNITVSVGAAGATGNIQYNNGGSLAGSTNLNYDAATNRLQLLGTDPEIELQVITTEPTTPSAGRMYLYAKSVGGRILPKIIGPGGFDTPLQSAFAQNKIAIYNPIGNSNTVPIIFGLNPTATGSATARNVATTNVFTRARRIGYQSAGTAGSVAALSNATATTQYTIGTGTVGVGGFYFVIRFGFVDTVTQAIKFVGMTSTTAAPNATASPATFVNSIGLGCATGDTNLSIYYGGSAAQTPIALGANFPAKTNGVDWYELILYAPSNANNSVSYRVLRINTGDIAEGTLTAATPGTQLPLSTTLLGPRIYTSNNATATAVVFDVGLIYMETDT